MCDVIYWYAWHDSQMYMPWLILCVTRLYTFARYHWYVWYDMAHWYAWHGSVTYMTWLTNIRAVTHSLCDTFPHRREMSLICVTWHDITHWYAWRDSVTYMTWLTNIRAVTHSLCDTTPHPREISLICVTWHDKLIDTRDMTHCHACHDSLTYVQCLPFCVTRLHTLARCHWYVWHDMAHKYAWHDSLTCITWLTNIRAVTHFWCDTIPPPREVSLICVIDWYCFDYYTCYMTYSWVRRDSFLWLLLLDISFITV